jgi:hypothetical protein
MIRLTISREALTMLAKSWCVSRRAISPCNAPTNRVLGTAGRSLEEVVGAREPSVPPRKPELTRVGL